MPLDRVFGNEKLHRDIAIAEAAGDQGEHFELACCDPDGLPAVRIGSEGFRGRSVRRDKHLSDRDRFATARDSEAKADAERRE